MGLSQLLVESAHSGLVEDILFLISGVNIGQDVVDPGVVVRLEHDAGLGVVHLVDAQRSVVLDLVAPSLLSDPVSHEKCLVSLLSSKPINNYLNGLLTFR